MNTLQDLRLTLDQHAGTVADDAATARVAAVRGRAVRVRRRRAAGGLAAVALVIGSLGVLSALPRDATPPQVADRVLAGVTAPETLTSLGYTYAFERGVESEPGSDRVVLELAASDRPRLVSWTGEGARLRLDGEGPASADAGFDDFTLVEPGESFSGRITQVSGDGAAFAVYELTKLAPGTSRDGVTIRAALPEGILVDGAIGRVGENPLRMQVTMPTDPRTLLGEFCRTAQKDAWLSITIDGGDETGTSCDTGPVPYDLVPRQSWATDGDRTGRPSYRPGDRVVIEARVQRGPDDRRLVEDPGLRTGFAVWEGDAATLAPGLGRLSMPMTVEEDGHTYEYMAANTGASGDRELSLAVARSEPVAVRVFYRGVPDGTMIELLSGGESVGQAWVGGGTGGDGSQGNVVVRPGSDDVTVRLDRPAAPGTVLGIATYRRVD